jgi:hypothetical protein
MPVLSIGPKKLTLANQPFLSVPVAANGADRKEVIQLSGQNEVPVLVNGEDTSDQASLYGRQGGFIAIGR